MRMTKAAAVVLLAALPVVSTAQAADHERDAGAPRQPASMVTQQRPIPTSPTSDAVRRVRVANTDGQGVNLRLGPSLAAARVKGLPEGAALEVVGPDRHSEGRAWRNVRDARDDSVGWVAGDFLGSPSVESANRSTVERPSLTPNLMAAARSLSLDESLAACGPAAAVAFARAVGRNVNLEEAVSLARGVGWTPELGMAGPRSQLDLLKRMGVAATLVEGIPVGKVIGDVRVGKPVIVHAVGSGGHYFVAEGYDSSTGRFDFGQSAAVVKGANGKRWFTLDELPALASARPCARSSWPTNSIDFRRSSVVFRPSSGEILPVDAQVW